MFGDPFNDIIDLSNTFDRNFDQHWKKQRLVGDDAYLKATFPVVEKENTDIHRARSIAEDSVLTVLLHKHKPP